jgi:hypothetical protein
VHPTGQTTVSLSLDIPDPNITITFIVPIPRHH